MKTQTLSSAMRAAIRAQRMLDGNGYAWATNDAMLRWRDTIAVASAIEAETALPKLIAALTEISKQTEPNNFMGGGVVSTDAAEIAIKALKDAGIQ